METVQLEGNRQIINFTRNMSIFFILNCSEFPNNWICGQFRNLWKYVRSNRKILLKKQDVRPQNLTSVQCGCFTWIRTKINGVRVRCPTIRRWSNGIKTKRYLCHFVLKVNNYFCVYLLSGFRVDESHKKA